MSGLIVREANAMAGVVHANNVGGPAYVATNGVRYDADRSYIGGWYCNQPRDIDNTLDDGLHYSTRQGTFTYELPVPNGSYLVELQMNETNFQQDGLRIFDIRMEAGEAFSDVEIVALSGAKSTALTLAMRVARDGGARDEPGHKDGRTRRPGRVETMAVRPATGDGGTREQLQHE